MPKLLARLVAAEQSPELLPGFYDDYPPLATIAALCRENIALRECVEAAKEMRDWHCRDNVLTFDAALERVKGAK